MILPIYAYGQPVLREVEIDADYPELNKLIDNMYLGLMYNANGVGLAAQQIGLNIKLFIIDTVQVEKEESKGKGIKEVFINAEIIEEVGDIWAYEEGCLSIPDIRGDVERLPTVKIRYQDQSFKEYEKTFEGINARVLPT